MLSRWPIRKKLVVGIVIMMFTIGALAATSLIGVYSFRGLAKSLKLRAPELDRSSQLARDVSRLTLTHEMFLGSMAEPDYSYFDVDETLRRQFEIELDGQKIYSKKETGSFPRYQEIPTTIEMKAAGM